MASLALHLLVAEEYLKFHKIDNVDDFIKGVFAPDMTDDKVASHFSIYKKDMSYTDLLKNKVDLTQYVKNYDIETDFRKGEFLHLFTDYVFYNQYLIHLNTYKTLARSKVGDLNGVLYDEYNRVMHWLKQNYTLAYINRIPSKFTASVDEKMQIFDENSLKKVINYLADVDIDIMYKMIQNTKGKFSLKLSF